MLQLYIVLFSHVACGLAGYSDNAAGNDIGGGYGYSGSFSGTGNPQDNFQIPHFDFNNFLSNFQRFQQDLQKSILAQADANQNFAKSGASAGGAAGGYGGTGGFGGGYSGQSFGGSFSGGFPGGEGFQFVPGDGVTGNFGPKGSGASAFGSVGPGGIQQRAGVFPENPNAPNVNVRFGAGDNPDGFRSVFTSSSSMTSNVDGKTKTVKQATTTVNDNGKVTTYTAKSP